MKKQFFKQIKLVLGLVVAIALPSCLQDDTTVTLNKDGSGTIVQETYLTAAMLQMSAQFAEPGTPDAADEMFNEEKAKAKAAKFGEGVEFVKMEKLEKDGRRGARTEYKFADINKVNVTAGSAMNELGDQAPQTEKDEDSVKFKYANGKLNIILPPTDFKEMAMEDDDEDGENAQMAEMMKSLMADMKMTLKVKIADGIKDTDASYTDGNTITLFDVEVGKMFAQKDKLKTIAKLAETDRDAAVVEFKKLDAMKVETSENVSVSLK